MPGCGLKASPHIESRCKQLKKQYTDIADMLKISGFGWDDQQKMIIVDKEIYLDWVKSHPNAAGLFKKPFPHYDDLALVYGKDRANGSGVECFADQAEAIDREFEEENQNLDVNVDEANLDDTPLDSMAETQEHPSPCNFSPHTTTTAADVQNSTSTTRGKRKRNGGIDAADTDRIADNIKGLRKVYDDKLSELILCFKNESDATNRKMQVFAELAKIEGLTATERIRAGVIIMEKQHLVDCLFAIEPNMHYDFVQHIFASQNL